jgi:hypothetical protein
MYYVMLNRQNGELLIISHDDFLTYDTYLDMDDNPLFTHLAIFSASYDKCLEYCEKRIGYKE